MRLPPQRRGGEQGINADLAPPNPLVAMAMQIAMMRSAQGYGELVADLACQGASLGVLVMVRIRGAAGTDETGLGGDELQVITIPHSQRLADRCYGFVGCGRPLFPPCGAGRPDMA